MRKHKYTFTILISSKRCKCSRTRLTFYHLESSAKSTVALMTGSAVRSHIWPKMGRTFYSKRIITYQLLSLAGLSLNSRTSSSSTSLPQDSSSTSSSPARERSALVDTVFLNLGQNTLAQITPAQLMRKAATVRSTQVTLSGKMPMELAMGRKPRDFLDPVSMNPEQLTSTPTKQDLQDEEIQKLAMQTHLEVQEREGIRRDLAERMKFVPPDLRAGEHLFYWQEDPSKIQHGLKIWKMVESGNHCS